MPVRDWMSTVLVTVRPDAAVAEAQHLMRHRRRPCPRRGFLHVGLLAPFVPAPAQPSGGSSSRYFFNWASRYSFVSGVMGYGVSLFAPSHFS